MLYKTWTVQKSIKKKEKIAGDLCPSASLKFWFTFISVSHVSTCVCTTSFHVYTDCPPPLLPADTLVSLGPGCRRGMEHSHALKTSGRHCGQCWAL